MRFLVNIITKFFRIPSIALDALLTSSLERGLFAAFLFSIPFQTRLFVGTLASEGGEWGQAWLWASDVFFIALLALWLRRFHTFRRALIPLALLTVFIPALVAHFDALSVWSFMKVGEGLLLYAYARSHRHWILSSSRWPLAFLAGLFINAVAALLQFALQQDIGSAMGARSFFKILGESPLNSQMAGVAKFFVEGAPVIRGYGFTPHPNILAALLLAGVAFVSFLYIFRGVRRLSHYSWSRQKEELLRGALLFILLLGIEATFSRSSMLIAVSFPILLSVLVLSQPVLRRAFGLETMRFVVLFIAAVLLISLAFYPFLASRNNLPDGNDQSVSLRMFYGEQAAEMIEDHPWTGVGPGHFVTALAERNPDLPAWEVQPVHNVVLLLASQYGVPAMFVLVVIFVLLILSAWHEVVQARDPAIRLASVCLLLMATAILLFSTADHFLWTSQQGRILLWFTLGLLAP